MSNKNNNLEEMMKQVTEDTSDEIVDTPGSKGNDRTKKIIAITGVSIVALVGIFFLLSFKWNTATTGHDKVIYDGEVTEAETIAERAVYPVDVPNWAKNPFIESEFFDDEERMNEMYEWVKETGFDGYLLSEVSPDDVFADDVEITNDVDEQFLEDGEENPHFMYVLREDYMRAFALTTQRLLNPMFGDWVRYQYSRDDEHDIAKLGFEAELFDDLFKDEWWSNLKSEAMKNKDFSSIPVYADWNNDDYGGLEFMEYKEDEVNPGRFFGTIDETPERLMEVEQVENIDEELLTINVHYDVKVPIKYVAFGKGDTKIEKTGWLEFELHPNSDPSDVNYRVVASNAVLKMD